jgi:cytochrome b pre-mRNA-processing protein 3
MVTLSERDWNAGIRKMLRLFTRKPRPPRDPHSLPSDIADRLYRAIVAQAREPVFYTELRIPDTPDGRYDLIVLHAVLVLRRLQGDAQVDRSIGQALFDRMFEEFDESLREMGVGDLRVGKLVKALARGMYGRLAAYGASLDAGDADRLAAALRRNVYRRTTPDHGIVVALADYVLAAEDNLAKTDTSALMHGLPLVAWPTVSNAAR